MTTEEITAGLTLLGRKVQQPVRKLETFPNLHPGRRYMVTLVCPEFTCVCPATGQPDFATITIRYIPDQRILESKSLKLYLWSYREEGVFHEHVTNQILDDLVKALDPWYCHVTGAFNVRGGISITVEAEYKRPESPSVTSIRTDAQSVPSEAIG
ncbi:MAG: preQ(1) synthase [Anaerolineae bacterium]|nr:preQ(1) synthase [Anaerolineae bacterium]MDW8100251.1 preQ(1) synthase [Anaerolineae bacterium]